MRAEKAEKPEKAVKAARSDKPEKAEKAEAPEKAASRMVTIDGISGAWNYTIGPIHVWRGTESLTEVNFNQRPVVIVAKYIPLPELGRIQFTHVLGFVLEEGGPGDPSMILYSNQHRATVLQAAGAIAASKEGATVVVDGVNGKVYFDPDDETIAKYKELRKSGPPPEPPGMTEKLMKVATDFKSLDPSALKNDLFDFTQLAGVMDGIMAAWRKEPLSREQRSELLKFAKGKPVEDSITKNIDRYDKWIEENPQAPAEDEKDDAKSRGRKPRDAGAEKGGEGRGGREERAKRGGAATSEADAGKAEATKSATSPGPAGAAGAVSGTGSGTSEGDTAKDAAAARRAAREAEIEAARKARRGDDKKPK